MKKLLCFGLILILATGVFSGCSSKEVSGKSEEELKEKLKAEIKAEMEAENNSVERLSNKELNEQMNKYSSEFGSLQNNSMGMCTKDVKESDFYKENSEFKAFVDKLLALGYGITQQEGRYYLYVGKEPQYTDGEVKRPSQDEPSMPTDTAIKDYSGDMTGLKKIVVDAGNTNYKHFDYNVAFFGTVKNVEIGHTKFETEASWNLIKSFDSLTNTLVDIDGYIDGDPLWVYFTANSKDHAFVFIKGDRARYSIYLDGDDKISEIKFSDPAYTKGRLSNPAAYEDEYPDPANATYSEIYNESGLSNCINYFEAVYENFTTEERKAFAEEIVMEIYKRFYEYTENINIEQNEKDPIPRIIEHVNALYQNMFNGETNTLSIGSMDTAKKNAIRKLAADDVFIYVKSYYIEAGNIEDVGFNVVIRSEFGEQLKKIFKVIGAEEINFDDHEGLIIPTQTVKATATSWNDNNAKYPEVLVEDVSKIELLRDGHKVNAYIPVNIME